MPRRLIFTPRRRLYVDQHTGVTTRSPSQHHHRQKSPIDGATGKKLRRQDQPAPPRSTPAPARKREPAEVLAVAICPTEAQAVQFARDELERLAKGTR